MMMIMMMMMMMMMIMMMTTIETIKNADDKDFDVNLMKI